MKFVILNHDDGSEKPKIDKYDDCLTKTVKELFGITASHLFYTDDRKYRFANRAKIPHELLEFYRETNDVKYALFDSVHTPLFTSPDTDTINVVEMIEKHVQPLDPVKHIKKPHLVVVTDSKAGPSRAYSIKYESTITSTVTKKYDIGVTNLTCIDHDISMMIVGVDMYGDTVTRNMRSILGNILLGFPKLPAVILYEENPLTVSRVDISKKAKIIDYMSGDFDYKSIVDWVGNVLKSNGYLGQ